MSPLGLPVETYNIWYPAAYPVSQSLCILQGLLSETSANATVLTITSFTVERYIAICHPFRYAYDISNFCATVSIMWMITRI